MENNYFALLANDVKKLWNGLDDGQKLGMLALIVVTIIAATFFLSKAMEPDWVVLYSDLNEVNALTIVENMKKNGYQYKVSEDKHSILVPSNVRDEMRVFVAENDLIKTGDAGFEILDDMQLGSTDFKNKLTKQRIFQGEITRAIEKIQGIRYAKVQLAEPERSIFEDNDEKPTASVMLVLEPGYKLKSSQVKAIKNLVAYSVPRMTPEQVFITDQNGNVLSDETSKNSTDMESFKSNLEKQTAKKVSEVLEKIVGKGNVSVQVNADIDFNSAKATIESYIPVNDKGEGVVVSSQTEIESYENPNHVPNSTAVNQRNLNYSKEKTAINYNVSKEVKQVIYAPGTVKRLSIAVAVNKILTSEEKDEIKDLVLSASGVDYSRGDVISISGLQFEGATTDRKVNMELEKQYQHEQLIYMVTSSVIPLIIVLVLGCFALAVLKGFVSKMPTPKKTERKVVEELIPKVVEEEEAPEVSPRIEFNKKEIQSRKEQTISEINEAVLSAPEDAAKLLTSFIRE
ncbi:MAG: flagellar M-ring protein FliF [Cyanobacteria bacterium SIG31]|nr:flagellar M-ring protein FliF [Cyanobacteria bacterium SIG31]